METRGTPDLLRPSGPRRGDFILSVLLPFAVIGLGVALSVGTEFGAAFLDLCLAPFR